MRGPLVLLGGFLVAIGAGLLGYQLGIAANVGAATTTATAAGTAVVAYPYWGWGFPHFFGGFLFFFLFIGLLILAFGGWRRRGPWGYRGSGPGPWGSNGPMSEGDPRRQWIADAHRRLHEEEARSAEKPSGPGAPPPVAG